MPPSGDGRGGSALIGRRRRRRRRLKRWRHRSAQGLPCRPQYRGAAAAAAAAAGARSPRCRGRGRPRLGRASTSYSTTLTSSPAHRRVARRGDIGCERNLRNIFCQPYSPFFQGLTHTHERTQTHRHTHANKVSPPLKNLRPCKLRRCKIKRVFPDKFTERPHGRSVFDRSMRPNGNPLRPSKRDFLFSFVQRRPAVPDRSVRANALASNPLTGFPLPAFLNRNTGSPIPLRTELTCEQNQNNN